MTLETLGLNGLKVVTETLATEAINQLTRTQRLLSQDRSRIGAYQNRLEHTINNLQTSAENLTAAESRIRDVDITQRVSPDITWLIHSRRRRSPSISFVAHT